MVNFYVQKIKNKTINQNTGLEWTVNDVPKYWKTNVEKALKA